MPRALSAIPLVFLLLAIPCTCAAGGLDEIKARGTVSFAMSGQYPPFNFVDEQNRLTGFDVAICGEIAKRIDVQPRPLSIAWDGIVAGLQFCHPDQGHLPGLHHHPGGVDPDRPAPHRLHLQTF